MRTLTSRKSLPMCNTRTPAPRYGGYKVMIQRNSRALPRRWVSHSRIGTSAQAHGLTREPALGRRQQVQTQQPHVAAQRYQRLRTAKQTGDLVGEADGEFLVHALTLAVRLQCRQVARDRSPGQQRLGERVGIPQGQVEAL